jgi:hypothetical protein
MRLAVMNVPHEFSHNANLPVTIASNGRIVNGPSSIPEETYEDTIINNAYENVNYSSEDAYSPVEQSASVLFVKVANNIYQHNLKPKVIDLYIVLAFIIKEKPKFRFSYRAIVQEYKRITGDNINVDSVNKYIVELENKGLLKKGKNKNCHLGIAIDIQDDETNFYDDPKKNYTPFYHGEYKSDLTKTERILEQYIATLPYKRLRRKLVTKEVNISLSTYNILLRSLRIKNFLYRNVIINRNIKYHKMFFYYPVRRREYIREYENWKIINFVDRREAIYNSRINHKPAHNSRHWFVGAMGDMMRKYKIRYIKAFDNYNIQDAYDIIRELENQNVRNNKYKLTAPIVVKAILEAWNWDKIMGDRHMKFKRLEGSPF